MGVQTVKETQGSIKREMPEIPTLGEKYMAMPGMLWNGIQYLRFNLDQEEKMLHQSAVYHTLNNVGIGEITSWHSTKRLATGRVRSHTRVSGIIRLLPSVSVLHRIERCVGT
jgi:hypothetical protein